MKIQYASDLHLEFPENFEYIKANPLIPAGDILILAGDILPFRLVDEFSDFFDMLSSSFKSVYWIPGNHEYYHSDLSEKSGYLSEKLRENVFIVNNTTADVGEATFLFSTLWTKISHPYQFEILQGYSDFHVIRENGLLLNISQYNYLHDQCFAFLKGELDTKRKGKVIVVTHHVPTFLEYPERYIGSPFNEVFAVELSGLIEKTKPDFWIYGHQHGKRTDFVIGKTKLTSNPLGYLVYNEQEGFDVTRFISI